MKRKWPLLITAVYIIGVIALRYLSDAMEHGMCYSVDPYWNYGSIRLPCYFFDTLYKFLLNPFYILYMISPVPSMPANIFFIVALLCNSIFVYIIVVALMRLTKKYSPTDLPQDRFLDYHVYHQLLPSKRDFYTDQQGRTEQVVFIPPTDAFQKGIRHFGSYKKTAFCTFFTGLTFWDTQSEYYRQGREAAKGLKQFRRVFLVDTISDLKKPVLKEQIRLDMAARIDVYLCLFKEIENMIPEPDFGTWDDTYLCIVPFGKDKKIKDIRISNRKEDLMKAKQWMTIILQHAKKLLATTISKNL